MPATDNQGSFLNRISIRRNQVVSMDNNHEQELEDLDLFQKHVADRFSDLLQQPPSPSSPSLSSPSLSFSPLLSIAWLRNLLDAFLCCEAEFKAVLVMGRDPAQFAKPPLDRLIPDLLDRGVKALDICNAVTHGLDLVRTWQSLAQIAVTALNQNPITEGHVRRAKKALTSLLTSMAYDDKENSSNNSDVSQSGGATGRRADWVGLAGLYYKYGFGFRGMGVGGGGAVPGEGRADGAFSGPEESELGRAGDRAAGEDRGGVEEEGEERVLWVAGGGAEDGEGFFIAG
ncbi:hypothetical protein RHSIM_Rhsim02G0235200 [Rhododendron simsii]|uniref:Uncharacterized protein n=1 Tax=Rhododendron simsii TaxID=118357 RepID=A0A834LW84_RHOSS|nr:hypothetical protein RHSIM_Rhsim02G0235200 [Rhododendron simsii]